MRRKSGAIFSANCSAGNGAIKRANAHAIIDVYACSTASHRIESRQMRSGATDGIEHASIVILRIAGVARIPHDFFAENRFAINHSARLPIARAQIETHAAAIEMTAERHGRFARFGNGIRARHHHFERMLIHRAHECAIETARAGRRIHSFDVLTNLGRAADVEPPPAALPQQKFHDAFDVQKSGGKMACSRAGQSK